MGICQVEAAYGRLADARQGGSNFLHARFSPTVVRMGYIACAGAVKKHCITALFPQ